MGISLPPGVVRMYQKDSSDETHFIGESRVHNIPEDENLTLTVGILFDAVGEKTITKFRAKKHYRNDITLKTSCKGNCLVKKKNTFVREFTIKLKAKEIYEFTSEFEVNY